MTNRKLIESMCNDRNLTIDTLEYIHNRDYLYGDSWDNSYWELTIYLDEFRKECYTTSNGDTIQQGIRLMFDEIDDDLNNI